MVQIRHIPLTLVLLLSAVGQADDGCVCDSATEKFATDALNDSVTPNPLRLAWRSSPDETIAFSWRPSEPDRGWQYIVIHHTATTSGSVKSIHREHRQRKDRYGNNWLGIGYHFVIGNGDGMEDGEISPTFRWKGQIHGAHSGSTMHNSTGIGVCLVGNFEIRPPSDGQVTALTRLLTQLTQRYNIPRSRIIRHSDVKPTACPGKLFPLETVLQRIESAG